MQACAISKKWLEEGHFYSMAQYRSAVRCLPPGVVSLSVVVALKVVLPFVSFSANVGGRERAICVVFLFDVRYFSPSSLSLPILRVPRSPPYSHLFSGIVARLRHEQRTKTLERSGAMVVDPEPASLFEKGVLFY